MSDEQQIVKFDIDPPVVHLNYEEAKAYMQTLLRKYDVIATDDNVGEIKKMATEVNKMAERIDRKRIDKIREASVDIKKADDQLKELVKMAKDTRARLKEQTDKWDQAKLDLVSELMAEAREVLFKKHKVREEFRSAEYDDMIRMGALTKSERLTDPAYSALEARVLQDKAKQDRVDMRLVQLENRSYRAELSTPLTREHVEGFLHLDDDEYEQRLEKLFERERAREAEQKRKQAEAQEKAVEEARKEAQEQTRRQIEEETRQAEKEQEERRLAEEAKPQEPEPDAPTATESPQAPEEQQEAEEAGPLRKWYVVATYELECPETADVDDVRVGEAEFLRGVGISKLKSVTAHMAPTGGGR